MRQHWTRQAPSVVLASALLLCATAAPAEVYKWVDEQGRIHYGDRPPAGTPLADLPDIQVVEPGTLPGASDAASGDAAPASANLASCLSGKGFRLYGASWCPQCTKQKKLFGSTASSLPYIECSPDGSKDRTQDCTRQGIKAYPTWVFPDGRRRSGVYSPQKLASLSGC